MEADGVACQALELTPGKLKLLREALERVVVEWNKPRRFAITLFSLEDSLARTALEFTMKSRALDFSIERTGEAKKKREREFLFFARPAKSNISPHMAAMMDESRTRSDSSGALV